MTQKELFELITATITAGLTASGLTGVLVRRGYLGTKQGALSGDAVYFYPLFDGRIGSAKKSSSWDGTGSGQMNDTQKQLIEASFQVFARINLGPNGEILAHTSSDVTHIVADWFMSDLVIMQLQAQNVGVLRVTDVANGFEVNDKDRHEQVPFFELSLSYTNTRATVGAPLESIEPGIYRV